MLRTPLEKCRLQTCTVKLIETLSSSFSIFALRSSFAVQPRAHYLFREDDLVWMSRRQHQVSHHLMAYMSPYKSQSL